MKNKRVLKIGFQKSGTGSMNTRINIPITWIRELEITPEDREIEAKFDGTRIIIEKKKQL